jgi:hypothetical protein
METVIVNLACGHVADLAEPRIGDWHLCMICVQWRQITDLPYTGTLESVTSPPTEGDDDG